ncbi:MAG: hypothetical protein OXE92_05345 [Bacteroidetes bacterium]|nr:hypothetical protein [Bacteroidota bacterium]
MTKILPLLLIAGVGLSKQVHAQAALSVTPAYALVTDEKPYGAFTLYNEGTEGVEITIRSNYGVIASSDSTTGIVLGEAGKLRDLVPYLTFFPDRCILPAGGEQTVRYRIRSVPEGAHITLMHFAMQERGAIVNGQVPAVASGLSIVYNLIAPLIYLQGRGSPILSARILDRTSGELHLYLENHSQWPFLGGVRVFHGNVQLGRAESAVYTTRKIRIPISQTPLTSSLRLEFDTEYTGLGQAIQRQLEIPEPIHLIEK